MMKSIIKLSKMGNDKNAGNGLEKRLLIDGADI